MPSLAVMALPMNSPARVPVSVGQISHQITLREKMSMMTYSR
jgi:hypothetical protein